MSDEQKALIVNALAVYLQTLIEDECYEDARQCGELILKVNIGLWV